jgi:hypothetical protein
MVSRAMFYGVIVVFVALLLIVSTVAASYFYQNQQETEAARNYAHDLNSTIGRYNLLLSNYRNQLGNYSTTLSLLAKALSNLNTSSAAYQSGIGELAVLWGNYVNATRAFKGSYVTYSVSMKVDYGNGTVVWYNDTAIQPGWNLYTATLVLLKGNVQATWYPTFQPPEHFVYGINGVISPRTEGWFIWEFDKGTWQVSGTGADPLQAYNRTTFAWTLCGYDQNFVPTCRP